MAVRDPSHPFEHSPGSTPGVDLTLSCPAPGVVVGHVTGELDYVVTPALRRRLFELVDDDVHDLVVDLTGVTLLSAAGLEMLLALDVLSGARGCTLHVVAATRATRRSLELTGLLEQLRVHPSLTDALAALGEPDCHRA